MAPDARSGEEARLSAAWLAELVCWWWRVLGPWDWSPAAALSAGCEVGAGGLHQPATPTSPATNEGPAPAKCTVTIVFVP